MTGDVFCKVNQFVRVRWELWTRARKEKEKKQVIPRDMHHRHTPFFNVPSTKSEWQQLLSPAGCWALSSSRAGQWAGTKPGPVQVQVRQVKLSDVRLGSTSAATSLTHTRTHTSIDALLCWGTTLGEGKITTGEFHEEKYFRRNIKIKNTKFFFFYW